jgi:hypothetical protein
MPCNPVKGAPVSELCEENREHLQSVFGGGCAWEFAPFNQPANSSADLLNMNTVAFFVSAKALHRKDPAQMAQNGLTLWLSNSGFGGCRIDLLASTINLAGGIDATRSKMTFDVVREERSLLCISPTRLDTTKRKRIHNSLAIQ